MALFTTISETTVLCLICLAAIIGNVSLFLILYKNRNLRTITNMYILNLAAADILVSILSMPVTVVTIIKQRWVFGHTACVLLGFFTILSFIASVMSLGMIAINRYFYIVKWNTYTNTFSKRKALFYGVAVWVVSISLASPPLFGWSEYNFIPGKSYCFVYWPSNVYYMYFMITVCFFGPLSVMAFSYYNILTFTREAKRKVSSSRDNLSSPAPQFPKHVTSVEKSDETRNENNLDIEQVCNTKTKMLQMKMKNENNPNIIRELEQVARSKVNGRNESKSRQRQLQVTAEETRITNTFILVVALFIICWAPFAITMFFDVYYPRPLPRAVDIISLLLGYLNSMCNPILYGVRNRSFKQGLLHLYSRFIPKQFRSTAHILSVEKSRITDTENTYMNS